MLYNRQVVKINKIIRIEIKLKKFLKLLIRMYCTCALDFTYTYPINLKI